MSIAIEVIVIWLLASIAVCLMVVGVIALADKMGH